MDWLSVILGAFIGIAGVFGLTSLALYPLLKRSFLLWNAARTFGFAIIAVAALPVSSPDPGLSWLHANLGEIGVAISAACSGPFLASYLERRIDLARLRISFAAVGWLGLAAILSTLLSSVLPGFGVIHDLALLVAIGLTLYGLAVAMRADSRAARFQAVAWGPLIAFGAAELTYELATGHEHPYWPFAILIAVVADFIITTIGLIDGFMVIKRERDLAIADVAEANRVSTLDPLTSIANRRGLALHFANPKVGLPRALAVIDCDHFKRINDNFGHDVGDEVLVAVAQSLQGDDLYVGRLGGEEFVALLYREDWQAQAEEARRRIEAGVRMNVPQLAFRVTGSAGIAAVKDDDTLASVLKRADKALYAAKDSGRDRSHVHEQTDFQHSLLFANAG